MKVRLVGRQPASAEGGTHQVARLLNLSLASECVLGAGDSLPQLEKCLVDH